jgi:hypothetical protein
VSHLLSVNAALSFIPAANPAATIDRESGISKTEELGFFAHSLPVSSSSCHSTFFFFFDLSYLLEQCKLPSWFTLGNNGELAELLWG